MLRKGRKSREISLSPRVREAIEWLARRPGTPQKIALRACIVLAAEGQRCVDIVQALGVHENTIYKWRFRWEEKQDVLHRIISRLEGKYGGDSIRKLADAISIEILNDAPRSGSPPRVHR